MSVMRFRDGSQCTPLHIVNRCCPGFPVTGGV